MAFVGDPFLTKRHDTKPLSDILEREATPGAGDFAPINLTSCTVRFLVSDRDGVPLFGGTADILNAVGGVVSYSPTPTQMALAAFADSDFPLTLRAEWEITYPDSVVETIPAGKDYRKLVVGLDLG